MAAMVQAAKCLVTRGREAVCPETATGRAVEVACVEEIMMTKEAACEAMSMDEWRAQRSERLVWMEEQRRVAAELQQILSEHKTMVEVMKEAFAEERRHLDEQRKTMEEQRRVYAEADAAWDLEREEDVRRIAKTSAALTEYCVKCCARVTKPVKGVESVKEAKPVDEAESIVVHVVPSKEGVRTYADAVSEPPSGRAKKGKRVEGATPPGGAAMVSCLRCGERGHGHWTCFREVHESRLWGRDPKRRRKRWRRNDVSVKVVSEKEATSAVYGMGETMAPLVTVGAVRGYEDKRSMGDDDGDAVGPKTDERRGVGMNEESAEFKEVALKGTADAVSPKTDERQGIGASGGTMELKEVAFQGTMRGGRGGCGRGGCDRLGSVRKEAVGYHT
jgi:hypothetical protein